MAKEQQTKALVAPLAAMIALAVAVPSHSENSYIEAVGPVESSSCTSRTVVVLGISFAASDAGSLAAVCRASSISGLRYVSIKGRVGSNGSVSLTKLVSLSVGEYVPGATPIYLSGPVSNSRPELGTVGVLGAVITSVDADSLEGSVIETVGTQPLVGGAILPSSIRVLEFATDSIVGSGTSTNSIVGSGASTNSIVGSGTSTNSIVGSGTSTNSIVGSGANTNSIVGSGPVHQQYRWLWREHEQHRWLRG